MSLCVLLEKPETEFNGFTLFLQLLVALSINELKAVKLRNIEDKKSNKCLSSNHDSVKGQRLEFLVLS